jgi:hypothetical protein
MATFLVVTLKRVTLGFGNTADMVETISLEPIDHSLVLGDHSDPRASTEKTILFADPLTFLLIPFVLDTFIIRDAIIVVRHLVPSRCHNET